MGVHFLGMIQAVQLQKWRVKLQTILFCISRNFVVLYNKILWFFFLCLSRHLIIFIAAIHLPDHLSSSPVLLRFYVYVLKIVVCPFVLFSFGHCVVCSSLIYGLWLPLWCLQTLLNYWFLHLLCLFNEASWLHCIVSHSFIYLKSEKCMLIMRACLHNGNVSKKLNWCLLTV